MGATRGAGNDTVNRRYHCHRPADARKRWHRERTRWPPYYLHRRRQPGYPEDRVGNRSGHCHVRHPRRAGIHPGDESSRFAQLPGGRHSKRHHVRHGAGYPATCKPYPRLRGACPPVWSRPQEPVRAQRIHRAASAREHRRHRCGEYPAPDQQLGSPTAGHFTGPARNTAGEFLGPACGSHRALALRPRGVFAC